MDISNVPKVEKGVIVDICEEYVSGMGEVVEII